MTKCMQEEILATLGAIAANTCFGFGFNVGGWIFAIKVISDLGCSLYWGIKESKSEGFPWN